MKSLMPFMIAVLVPLVLPSSTLGFSPNAASLSPSAGSMIRSVTGTTSTQLFEKIRDERRKQLGIGQGEDEYDLEKALDVNTDPLITKIIAGSFILVLISLLVVGVIIPYTTDYGDGVCNPMLTAGRC